MEMARRVFCGVAAAGSAGWALALRNAESEEGTRLPGAVLIAEFDSAGRSLGVHRVSSVRKSDAEWKRILAVDQYTMTRRADTEMAFAGEYWNFHGDGLYRCVCCGTALFDSKAKFASGTGWPSFTEPVAGENIVGSPDRSWGMQRTAVSCRRCGAHLGHVFEDGPPPGGRRYCINSVAMLFVARA